jgi:hypothetical protein
MREGKKNDYQDGNLRWDLLPLEEIDDETKVNHLAAVAWNAIAMLYLDKHGKGKDYDIK